MDPSEVGTNSHLSEICLKRKEQMRKIAESRKCRYIMMSYSERSVCHQIFNTEAVEEKAIGCFCPLTDYTLGGSAADDLLPKIPCSASYLSITE